MDVKLIPVLFLVLLIPSTAALRINVEIEERVDGNLAWFNISSTTPQRFSISWDNLGTAKCRSRARIDFFNGSRRVYTGWSEESIMKPGKGITWDIYSYLDTGQYNYTMYIYHCNDIHEFGPYPFVAINTTPLKDVIEIINSGANNDTVELFVTSKKDLNNIIIIPEKYPTGWIFETGKLDTIRAGEVKPVRMDYEPIDWEKRVIGFVAVTEDGNYAEEKPIILKPYEASYDKVVFILILATILVIYLYFRKSSFLIWKR